MGRKSSAKTHNLPPTAAPPPTRSFTTLLVAGIAMLAVVAGGLLYWRQTTASAGDVAQAAAVDPQTVAQVPDVNKRPHKQTGYPQLNFPAYPMPRPTEVVTAAYQFAAEHPEVLSYVPCFCGCERSGHRGNEDCFVKARDVNADVIEWQEHGMECAVCLDVAYKSMRMHASGASVRDIRAAIEKEYGPRATNHTPTPPAP
jgi:uncharacterized protein with PCYCGC motif